MKNFANFTVINGFGDKKTGMTVLVKENLSNLQFAHVDGSTKKVCKRKVENSTS